MNFEINNFIEELQQKLNTIKPKIMELEIKQFTGDLESKLNQFDKEGVITLCEELIKFLYQSPDGFPVKEGENVLSLLKNKRMFALMQKVGSVLIQTDRQSAKIRRLYSQSLIDQNFFTASLAYLNNLVKETNEGDDENKEARGLIGRVYKQLYVNADNPANPKNIEFLKKSLIAYYDVYNKYPNELWHGINTVALLKRAERDKTGVSELGIKDSSEIALAILKEIEKRDSDKKADTWDFATAVEACLALNNTGDALKWLSKYLDAPYTDAFELASTLRQFEEVWQLNMNSDSGEEILPMLRGKLLKREGGNLTMNMNEIQKQKLNQEANSKTYEKVFGTDSFKTYNWYMTGADCCLAVARIGKESAKGFGTGFLMTGNSFHEKLNNELVLLTNAHVISENPADAAIQPDDVVITFEVLNELQNKKEEFQGCEIIWSSPKGELDATLIRFNKEDIERLKELTKKVIFFPIAKKLPVKNDSQRIYIIGHPSGGTLQLSFVDNLLLDYEAPDGAHIHYRTPTVGGSSGSPVFNEDWKLIGLHHAGSKTMLKLHGEGAYEANEGIWIKKVIDGVWESLEKKDEKK